MTYAADNLLRRIVAHHKTLAGPKAHAVGCDCSGSQDGKHSCASYNQTIAEAQSYLDLEKPMLKYSKPDAAFINRKTVVDDLAKIGALLAACLAVVLIVLALAIKPARAEEQKFMGLAILCINASDQQDCQQLSSPNNPFSTFEACVVDITSFDTVMRDGSGIAEKWRSRKEVSIFEWAVACVDYNGVVQRELRGTVKVGGQAL